MARPSSEDRQHKEKAYKSGLYDLDKYGFERTELDDQWDAFVARSPQGTVFASSAFLEATGQKLGLWKCLKNGQWVGAIAVGESDDGRFTCPIPYVIHAGIMQAAPPKNQPLIQTQIEGFRLVAASIEHLAHQYESVYLALSPEIKDMRPFLWHNYNGEGPRFHLDLRYTSFVGLQGAGQAVPLDSNAIFAGCDRRRRRDIRLGLDAGITTRQIDQVDDFLALYEMTFARQDITLDRAEVEVVANICMALKQADKMRMYGAFNAESTLAGIFVFGLDSKRAYYLYGANHPDFRDSHCGTIGLFQSLNFLADEGCLEADWEGVNSPDRGYFKLSFGGSLTPYYRVSLST